MIPQTDKQVKKSVTSKLYLQVSMSTCITRDRCSQRRFMTNCNLQWDNSEMTLPAIIKSIGRLVQT